MERRLITDLDTKLVTASKSVLLEIMTILGDYRKSLVLVGGWAPYFIIETFKPVHVNLNFYNLFAKMQMLSGNLG